MEISEKEYYRSFPTAKRKEALEHALDIRKFEIELYWKRATYFWALIAAALVGYTAIQNAEKLQNKTDYSVAIACLGILFSFGWHCAIRGSKQWQENWENHVDMLEDDVIGPLYKTVLRRRKAIGKSEKLMYLFTAPWSVSVSGINQIISIYVVALWIALLFHALPPFLLSSSISWVYVFLVVGMVLSCIGFLTVGRTHLGAHGHVAKRRASNIGAP